LTMSVFFTDKRLTMSVSFTNKSDNVNVYY
jgi:hypothetical protein